MISIKKIISVAMVVGVSACTTLSTEDRKLMDDIKLTSETAKYDAQKALRAAETSVDMANDAKECAACAAEKANRIFKQSQKK